MIFETDLDDPVEWHFIDVYQLEFLHELFKNNWNLIGQFVNHSPLECWKFWKRCKLAANESDEFFHEEVIVRRRPTIHSLWGGNNNAHSRIIVTEKDIQIVPQKILTDI